MDLKQVVRSVQDFPVKGVLFRDIVPVLQDAEALECAIDSMEGILGPFAFDKIAAPESRGFIFGMPLAYKLKRGFIPIRKAGKLPCETIRRSYSLEYGSAVLEMDRYAVRPGERVIIADDLLATGGTCKAIAEMLADAGAAVAAMAFFIELEDLRGRELLRDYNVVSVLKY